MRFTPVVGWAERGGLTARGHGNSVPRFHLTWGTGPEVVRVFAEPVERGVGIFEPFADRARAAAEAGQVAFRFRHRVDGLVFDGSRVVGVRGSVLAPDTARRGAPSNRDVVSEFEFRAQAVVIASGGIGGNHEQVRKCWPERLGKPPRRMISGVPQSVDGRMLDIATDHGVRLVNRDRMWH